MNIADKPTLYADAFRTLRPGGRFVAHDVLQCEGGDVHYPVPWANDPSTSFLATAERLHRLLTDAGFELAAETGSSDASLTWFRQVREGIEAAGPPLVSFAAFLGDDFPHMAANQVANLSERRIRTVMFVCCKPAGSGGGGA